MWSKSVADPGDRVCAPANQIFLDFMGFFFLQKICKILYWHLPRFHMMGTILSNIENRKFALGNALEWEGGGGGAGG